ncbi:MAG: M64 family metallopeptidase [Pseudomonadota bacterium]|nr:M64 family metallopeptidase [Pseudomonadota bacterium]
MLPFLALFAACRPPLDEPVALPVGLPTTAPGVILLAMVDGEGAVTVGGTVQAELWVDLDGPEDERYAFRYLVLDEAGEAIYARSTLGPLIVQEFLAYYSEDAGFDLLGALPQLGQFPVLVPVLDGAASVRFEARGDDGVYKEVGRYDLGDVEADDQGLSDVVSGAETLHDAGDSRNRLDIVLMGDGYTADEQALWRSDAELLAQRILGTEPLASFADRINIHRVDAVSAESGVSYDCTDTCGMRDTAYGSVFAIEVANALLGTDYRSSAIFQLDQWGVARAAATFPWDMVVIVANTTHTGGFAVHYATVPKGSSDWTSTGVHELGHTLGLLGDEYESDACIRSDALGLPENVTDAPSAPPWAAWIDAETPLPTPDDGGWEEKVGAFEGAWNCPSLYRPAHSCKMRGSSYDAFCPVCAELLARRLFRYSDPAAAVTVGAGAYVLEDLFPGARTEWWVDGVLAAEDVETFTPDAVPAGSSGEVEVRVSATTPFVRVDGGDLSETWRFDVR